MNIHEIATPPKDAISSLRFSPDSHSIIVGSWECSITTYTSKDAVFTVDEKIECDAPVLDVSWGADSTVFFSVGLDQAVTMYTMGDGKRDAVVLSNHDKAASKVAYSPEQEVVISIGWDATMHVHDPATHAYVSIELAAKPFALALTADKAVVTMAERKVHVYSLPDLKALISQAGETSDIQSPIHVKPWQERESSLKFMVRASACMPDGTGFAVSSIEGRVGVEWFDEQENQNMYAFKCHRAKETRKNEEDQEVPIDIIYPVNALAFHPGLGTFATGGGDGVVVLWDAKTKRRIRQYPRLPACVSALHFSPDGTKLAIGVSPGFEDGKEEEETDPELVKLFVRELGENEAKGKPLKEK